MIKIKEVKPLWMPVCETYDHYRDSQSLLVNQFTMDDSDRNILRRFEIAFMSEGKYGDRVDIMRQSSDGVTSFAIRCNGVPLVRARFSLMSR